MLLLDDQPRHPTTAVSILSALDVILSTLQYAEVGDLHNLRSYSHGRINRVNSILLLFFFTKTKQQSNGVQTDTDSNCFAGSTMGSYHGWLPLYRSRVDVHFKS